MELQEALNQIEKLTKEKIELENKVVSFDTKLKDIKNKEIETNIKNIGVRADVIDYVKTKVDINDDNYLEQLKEYTAKNQWVLDRKPDIDKPQTEQPQTNCKTKSCSNFESIALKLK